MAPLSNPQYERFALLVARGMPQSEAYRRVGFKTVDHNRNVSANATRLAKTTEVEIRIRELQEQARARLGITQEHLIKEANAAYRLGRKTNQPNAMIAATAFKAKLLGLVVDRAEVEGTLRRPMREPGDHKQMSMEEWQEKFAVGSNVVPLPKKDAAP
jgi:phage terminase small subunit